MRAEDGVKETTTAAGQVHRPVERAEVGLVTDPAQTLGPRRHDAVLLAELRPGQALEADRPDEGEAEHARAAPAPAISEVNAESKTTRLHAAQATVKRVATSYRAPAIVRRLRADR